MDIDTILAEYRMKFGYDQAKAEGTEPDLFAQPQQGEGVLPQQNGVNGNDVFRYQDEPQQNPSHLFEGQRASMEDFARFAEQDSILSYKETELHDIVNKLRSVVADASNPVDEEQGISMLNQILDRIEQEEREGAIQ